MGLWSKIKDVVRGRSPDWGSYEMLEQDKERKEQQTSSSMNEPEDAEESAVSASERLSDLAGDGGGQQSEVGVPYSGEGGVRRGVRDDVQTDEHPRS